MRNAARFPVIAVSTLLLAACGGGSSGGVNRVASVPTAPPPPPEPTFVRSTIEKVTLLSARAGLTDGNYGLKAVIDETTDAVRTTRILTSGEATLGVDAAARTYTLTVSAEGFPSGQAFNLASPPYLAGGDSGFGYHVIQTGHYSDGSTVVDEFDNNRCCGYPVRQISADRGQITGMFLDIRHQYVTLGEWEDRTVEYVGPLEFHSLPDDPSRRIAFVQGIRTEPGDIPLAGTASYVDDSDFLHLDANFTAQMIAADIKVEPYADSDDPRFNEIGITASGSAPILASGDFLIPLTGSYFTPRGLVDGTLTGTVDGAFFGPQATEIGGVYQLFKDGAPDLARAFVGAKAP